MLRASLRCPATWCCGRSRRCPGSRSRRRRAQPAVQDSLPLATGPARRRLAGLRRPHRPQALRRGAVSGARCAGAGNRSSTRQVCDSSRLRRALGAIHLLADEPVNQRGRPEQHHERRVPGGVEDVAQPQQVELPDPPGQGQVVQDEHNQEEGQEDEVAVLHGSSTGPFQPGQRSRASLLTFRIRFASPRPSPKVRARWR